MNDRELCKKRMKILIVIVNYNSFTVTSRCLESIFTSLLPKGVTRDVCVVDNASDIENRRFLERLKRPNLSIVQSNKNIGYFPGLNLGLKQYNITEYDYVIVGNNDLLFSDNFFESLCQVSYMDKYFAISPDIVTLDGIHQNPHEPNKIPKLRILMYRLYFIHYLLGCTMYNLQQVLKRINRKKNRVVHWEKETDVFLGYGAIYILTKSFFKVHDKLQYPHFLMGEEVYLSFQIYNSGGSILYDPHLKVRHLEHSSVSMIKNRKMYKITKQAFKRYKNLLNKINF